MVVASPKLQVETPYGQNATTSANPDKDDIYKVGVILLELLTGRQITSESQAHEVKQEVIRNLKPHHASAHKIPYRCSSLLIV